MSNIILMFNENLKNNSNGPDPQSFHERHFIRIKNQAPVVKTMQTFLHDRTFF